MGHWLRFNSDNEIEDNKYMETEDGPVNAEFNLCLGLNPMNKNTFDYFIKRFLVSLYKGKGTYLSIGYEPHRPDGISAIQTYRPHPLENDCSVEIIVDSDNEKGFSIFCRKNQTLKEAIAWFEKVLVDFKCPDFTDWVDITDICTYVDVE